MSALLADTFVVAANNVVLLKRERGVRLKA